MRHVQGRAGECPMARTTKQDSVRDLQRTLYRAAKADPGRRFHALYDKVYRRDVLERAWELVRTKRGAAGIDHQTIADVEAYGIAKLLDGLAADLKDGSYRTLPARRVFIPKPGRPDEQRPLSIPAVRDRVVQAAVKIVIEPIFEADFLPCSFGFRPKRAQHDALQVLVDQSWRGRRWVVESDVADCFEAIPHSGLMSAIEERISDRHLLKLMRVMPRSGVMQDGAVMRGEAGTPQGGVVSPLRCNVYLHVCPQRKRGDVEGRFVICAVLVMEVGPPGSPCRRGAQTAVMSCRSKAGVGSDHGNGSLSAGQVCDEKTNMVEPLLTHRKTMTASQPGLVYIPGRASRDWVWCSQRAACVSLWWCSVLRWRELVVGAGMEEENLCLDTVGRSGAGVAGSDW